MSTIAPFPDAIAPKRVDLMEQTLARKRVIRKRPNPMQGKALEKLGHAIEYLVDSRMALIHEPSTRADAEALDILMRLSRCVFAECEELVSVGQRLKTWIASTATSRVQ